MILLGTSGFSFPDWYGVFYPPELARAKQLDYYARVFGAVEVNSTYYRIPPPRTFEAMERKTPAGFQFVVKANSEMTHKLSRAPELYEAFHASMEPLVEARKLGGVLAQFPQSFHRSAEHEAFLLMLQELMEGVPLFVEFRHESWVGKDADASEALFEWMEREGLGYVSVDEPDLPGLLPRVARATGPLGYVRFHGRNKRNWHIRQDGGSRRRAGGGDGGQVAGDRGGLAADRGAVYGGGDPETNTAAGRRAALRGSAASPGASKGERRLLRYDYLYSEAELKEWAEKIRELNAKTQKTFVFFNNCHAGQAATSAKLMRTLLGMPEPHVAEQTGLL